MAEGKIDYVFKVVLFGDNGVGKTSIALRFVDNTFEQSPFTIESFKLKTLEIGGKQIKLQIFDGGGFGSCRASRTANDRPIMGIILVYDITSETSFKNITKWNRRLDESNSEYLGKLIIGNKCDLESQREVSCKIAEQYAQQHNIKVIECSAMENINIEQAFKTLTQDILSTLGTLQEKEETTPEEKSEKVKLQNNDQGVSGRCF